MPGLTLRCLLPGYVYGAAMVVRVDSSVGSDNVRSDVTDSKGDIEPLLADGRSESVAAGKA